jgi:hypothetical protein
VRAESSKAELPDPVTALQIMPSPVLIKANPSSGLPQSVLDFLISSEEFEAMERGEGVRWGLHVSSTSSVKGALPESNAQGRGAIVLKRRILELVKKKRLHLLNLKLLQVVHQCSQIHQLLTQVAHPQCQLFLKI